MFKDSSKAMRKERYYKIPLCQKDCDSWFNACKDDYTCRDNWNKGFKWLDTTVDNRVTKQNFCPDHVSCETFRKTFKEAKNFCEQVWDDSFEVADSNDSRCISFVNNKRNAQVSEELLEERYGAN